MNDSKLSGTVEYIPERVFVVGGDESGSRTTCRGDSGSPVVRFRQNPDPGSDQQSRLSSQFLNQFCNLLQLFKTLRKMHHFISICISIFNFEVFIMGFKLGMTVLLI